MQSIESIDLEHGSAAKSLTIEERLLLACARPVVDSDWQTVVHDLVLRSPDWRAVVAGADANFLTMLVLRHLRQSCLRHVPQPVLKALEARQFAIVLRALDILRIQRLIVEDILQPLACRFALVKGVTLSQQFYGDSTLRQYRDIDVLVESAKLAKVGDALLSRGYRIINKSWDAFRVKDLESYCQYVAALELKSPTGVIVELHRRLDNSGCVFDSEELLGKSIAMKVGQESAYVLPSELLFVYLCFHHSRHRWEHLHWCADLAALRNYTALDDALIRKIAAAHGLTQTVDESWKLHQNLCELAKTGVLSASAPQSRFLPDCLRSLRASVGLSEPLDQDANARREPDFVYPWQKTAGYRARFLISRVHPSENDYNALPLPRRMHWFYYLSKPIRVIGTRFLSRRD